MSKLRIFLIILSLLFGYLLVVSRLFYWQIVRGDELHRLSIIQSADSLLIPAVRGEILTADGFPLATNKKAFLLFANPKVLGKDEKEKTAKELSRILGVEEATISASLAKDLYWVKLFDRISSSEKKRMEEARLKGIGFEENDARYYPEGSMAAHLVGFLGKDAQANDKGYFGLEGYYDSQLAGRNGRVYAVRDALGNIVLGEVRQEESLNGRTLVTTIDRTVQYVVEQRLAEGIKKYQADGGSVVVMNPKTGAILAMASFPNFDPGEYYKFNPENYANPVISNLYEPGSTFKVIVMAAAIDLGLVSPNTRCNICQGPVKIGDYEIKTWNNKYYPNSTMTEVIQHSDNTGMVFVAQKLGVDNLLSYLEKFGFGYQTGIDLQGEASLPLRPRNKWYPVDLATAGFGQGISVTPIQLLTAVSTIANGGDLFTPYVVSKIITNDKKTIEIKPKSKRKVIKEETASLLTWMMVNAVNNGEAKWARIKDFNIAGKTGTAQIPISGHYDPNQTIASFVGFFPAEDPKISMLVLLNKPKTSIYGSETAAPIFFSIARDLIAYYGIRSKNR
jgi:cell division protein FtsI/penicillin-binding protein 2